MWPGTFFSCNHTLSLFLRVSKVRDELLALRTECSCVYNKGRTLTSEQTKMMISGITQSLNSGFSQNFSAGLSPALTSALTHGGLVTMGSGHSPALTPALTPGLTPGMQPTSVQAFLNGRGGGGIEPAVFQQFKHMQIRKPMLKSSFMDPNLTEDEVNMKFVQDLLNWVEEMHVSLFNHHFCHHTCKTFLHLSPFLAVEIFKCLTIYIKYDRKMREFIKHFYFRYQRVNS